MRRIVITCAAAAAFTCAEVYIAGSNHALAQSKTKVAAKMAATPTYGNSDAITEEELKVYDYFLASDELEGRNFPSRGYDTAALYVASHLSEWGLKPGGSTSGTNGPLQPYFMPIELVTRAIVPEDSKATLTAPAPAGRGGRGGGGGGGARGAAGGNAQPAPDQNTTFEYGKDWTMGGGGGGRGGPAVMPLDVTGNLVFAGNGYVITKTKANPYEGVDVKGKIIVVAGLPPELAEAQGGGAGGGRGRGGRGGGRGAAAATDAPPAAGAAPAAAGAAAGGGGRGAAAPNPLGEACTDYWTPEQYGAKNGALAVVTIANFQQLTAMSNPNAGGRGGGGGRGGLNGPNYQVKRFTQAPACAAVPAVTAGLEMTNALFQGEREAAQQVFYSAGSNAKVDSFEFNARKKLELKLAVHSQDGHSENVVGMLEGSDPVLKNEFVIMSAHLDHIGLSAPMANGHNVNNGADDDGSGSTALLGLAHAYATGAAKGIRPKRSVIFLWNGGEEKGLLGSQYFAEFPPIDITKVVADLNIDMIGRTMNPNSVDTDPTHVLVNQGEVLLIGPNISSSDLGNTINTVNSNYQKLKIDHFYDTTAPDAEHDNKGPQPNGQRIFYRSDHYNFAKVGIPIAFFTTGLHVDYHRPTDTPEKIDWREMVIVTKTVSATAWELANQSGRPQLKSTLPELLVKDMKTAKDQGWGKLTPVLPPLPGEPY